MSNLPGKRLAIRTLFSMLTVIPACTSSSKMYRPGKADRIFTGKLEDSKYESVKKVLRNYTGQLRDTIIIKYDYNNETCWDNLDKQQDDHIKGFISRINNSVHNHQKERNNVSIFTFRQAGNNNNKIKKWDTTIMVDSSQALYHLIFKEKSKCGNSIVILPDQRYITIRSDAHFIALNFSRDSIVKYLEHRDRTIN